MAPEVHDTSKPKTNRVDIWSLGCILYRMLAGNVLFDDPVKVWKYTLTAPSSPLAFDNIGFSAPCVSFLRDVLQPVPKNRPSAEDCLKKPWITNRILAPEYSIGKDLYARLSRINRRAPNVNPPPDTVANRAADSSSASQQLSGATMPPRQEAGRPWWPPFLVLVALRLWFNLFSATYRGTLIDEFVHMSFWTLTCYTIFHFSPPALGFYYTWHILFFLALSIAHITDLVIFWAATRLLLLYLGSRIHYIYPCFFCYVFYIEA